MKARRTLGPGFRNWSCGGCATARSRNVAESRILSIGRPAAGLSFSSFSLLLFAVSSWTRSYKHHANRFRLLFVLLQTVALIYPTCSHPANRFEREARAASALSIAGLVLAINYLWREAGEKDQIRFNISLEGMTTITSEVQNSHLAVSPDGRRLAL